jgi:prepilin-type N-terminal cleavage/methylation domain-containing protein
MTGRRIVRSEGGFTLPEVLMAVAVLGIIVVPLTNAMVVGLRSSGKTTDVLVASADRQMLTNYLPPDALSATAATADGSVSGCASPAGTRVLLLTWSEFTGTVTSYASDYRLVPGGTTTKLVRDRCVAGGVAEEVTVAHDAVAAAPLVNGATVGITVTDSLGAQYTVSGSRRVG